MEDQKHAGLQGSGRERSEHGPSFRLPLSTGGTSQLDTCKQPRSFIPSLIHLFIQPEKCLLRGSLSVPICKTERVTAPQWAVVEITDVSM